MVIRGLSALNKAKSIYLKTWPYLCMARPQTLVLAFGGTLIGMRLSGTTNLPIVTIFLIALANTFGGAASNLINDCYDVKADMVNKPQRPLPAGKVSRNHALLLARIMFILAVLINGFVIPVFGLLAFLSLALSILYTLKMKTIPLLGNLTVAIVGNFPLWCWLGYRRPVSYIYLISIIANIGFIFGREIVKTAEDVRGDVIADVKTLASTMGTSFASQFGSLVMWTALSIGWVPIFLNQTTWLFNTIYGFSYIISLVIFLIITFTHTSNIFHSQIVRASRMVMFLLALAYGFGLRQYPPI